MILKKNLVRIHSNCDSMMLWNYINIYYIMVCFLTHNFLECIYIYIYTEEDRMGETSVINHIKKFVSNS